MTHSIWLEGVQLIHRMHHHHAVSIGKLALVLPALFSGRVAVVLQLACPQRRLISDSIVTQPVDGRLFGSYRESRLHEQSLCTWDPTRNNRAMASLLRFR